MHLNAVAKSRSLDADLSYPERVDMLYSTAQRELWVFGRRAGRLVDELSLCLVSKSSALAYVSLCRVETCLERGDRFEDTLIWLAWFRILALVVITHQAMVLGRSRMTHVAVVVF